uniref:Uncharacterized protein n=1 Tax=Percolomonas cosmopolitus TaxID=63605 RepID=A0A7S1PHQ2_9EUKA|mmetsp:Transcript_2313/g.8617  ORF Transcript_2313/g.8617 Transcript_2313/m.8617 type:complete len:359 (+) Transcript_2313:1466-2542(+)
MIGTILAASVGTTSVDRRAGVEDALTEMRLLSPSQHELGDLDDILDIFGGPDDAIADEHHVVSGATDTAVIHDLSATSASLIAADCELQCNAHNNNNNNNDDTLSSAVVQHASSSDSDQDSETSTTATDRHWQVAHCNTQHAVAHNLHDLIYVKNRRAKSSLKLGDKMYATLKYELQLKLTRNMLQVGAAQGKNTFIQTRVTLMDASTNEEVLTDGDKNAALTGDLKAILVQNESNFSGKLVVQPSNKLSYHRRQRAFYLRVFFFMNDEADAFLCMDSAQFKVFARKPNKKNYNQEAKKRKRDLEDNVGGVHKKKAKKASKKMDKFMLALEKLISCKEDLAEDEKMMAVELCLKKLRD